MQIIKIVQRLIFRSSNRGSSLFTINPVKKRLLDGKPQCFSIVCQHIAKTLPPAQLVFKKRPDTFRSSIEDDQTI